MAHARRSVSTTGIQLIDLRTGAEAGVGGHSRVSPIWLQFSPDGKTIVSTSRDGTVTVWDAGALTPRETLRGHSDSVWQPVFSPDGRTLYTTSTDGSAIAWDLSRERRFGRPFTFTHDRGLYDWPDTPSGDVQPGRPADRRRPQRRGIRLLDCEDARPGRRAPAGYRRRGERARVQSGRADARRRHLTGMSTLWDVDSRSLRLGPFAVSSKPVESVSISADGTMLATAARTRGVTLWDAATGAALGSIRDGSGGDRRHRRLQPDRARRSRSFAVGGLRRPGRGRRRRRDLGRRPARADRDAEVDSWPAKRGMSSDWTSPSARTAALLATGGTDQLRAPLGRQHRTSSSASSSRTSARPAGARVQPRRQHPRHLRLGEPYASLWTSRPENRSARGSAARQPRHDGRPVPRRTPPAA